MHISNMSFELVCSYVNVHTFVLFFETMRRMVAMRESPNQGQIRGSLVFRRGKTFRF